MRVRVDVDDLPRRRDELCAHELIAGEPPRPDEESDAAAEGETAHTDGCGVAGGDGESVRAQRVGDGTPRRTAPEGDDAVGVDGDVGEGGEVDHDAARDRSPCAVPAAAHEDGQARPGRRTHGVDDVLD